MVFLGAFYITLYYQSGESDLTIGTDTANRSLPQWQHQLGFFVNQLALRFHIKPSQSVYEFYAQLRQQTLLAYQHQSYPFDQLVSTLNPARQSNATPFFSSKLVWQRLDLNTENNSELTMNEFQVLQQATEFDLILDFVESPKGLSAHFTFNPTELSRHDIERFTTLYSLALNTMICNSSLSIHQVHQRLAQADIVLSKEQSINTDNKPKIRRRRTPVSA